VRPLARSLVSQPSPGRARNMADDGILVPDRHPSRADSGICVQLAVSGWRIRWRLQPDGRAVIEVSDETDDLIGLVVGTRLPIVSADAGWCGTNRSGGARQWWALAIGHVPADADRPAVTFMRGRPGIGRERHATVHPATTGGLWVAAILGRYTTVRCHLTSPETPRLTVPGSPGIALVTCRSRPGGPRRPPCERPCRHA
jgi:hypothetical protein